MKNTLIINLFGAPGSGKSTGAAYLFSQLKMANIDCELVTEFAKDKVWEDNKTVFNDQLYILGKQHFKISRVFGKVDVIITDSPLLLSKYYNQNLGETFNKFVEEVFSSYNNYNVFIHRVKDYNPNGRHQDEFASNLVGRELYKMIMSNLDLEIEGDDFGYQDLVSEVLRKLKITQND